MLINIFRFSAVSFRSWDLCALSTPTAHVTIDVHILTCLYIYYQHKSKTFQKQSD